MRKFLHCTETQEMVLFSLLRRQWYADRNCIL